MTKKRSSALAVVGLSLVTIVAGCHPQRQPATFQSQARPGPDCLTTCDKEYKECAYGSECMMTAECDMQVCIPRKQDCRARCAEGK